MQGHEGGWFPCVAAPPAALQIHPEGRCRLYSVVDINCQHCINISTNDSTDLSAPVQQYYDENTVHSACVLAQVVTQ